MPIRAHSAAIARAFLPTPNSFDRYHYYYARAKLATDPVYDGVLDALRGTQQPLLDIGCGIGLLAHALHADGQALAYAGMDVDARKIAAAHIGARNASLRDTRFAVADIAREPPRHHGSVAILDVLQYLSEPGQRHLLHLCAREWLAEGGRLVIRSGLREDNTRSRVTRVADRLARVVGWMQAQPQHFPSREWFAQQFQALELRFDMQPLRGNTPFNNWLIVARPR